MKASCVGASASLRTFCYRVTLHCARAAAALWTWSPKSKTKHKSTADLPQSARPCTPTTPVSTGAKARLQVTFRDQTNLTLGENATVVIDRYVFDPDASVGEATLNVTKGAFRLATGRLSEMTKKDIKVSTPFAAAAVRGTDFWGGAIEGQFGVLLVHNSRLEVRDPNCTEGTEEDPRRCRCAVTLDQAGEGTDIDRRDRCPGVPIWPQGKIDAALAMTGFSLAFAPSNAIPAAVGVGQQPQDLRFQPAAIEMIGRCLRTCCQSRTKHFSSTFLPAWSSLPDEFARQSAQVRKEMAPTTIAEAPLRLYP